jgi:hypothetical protein
VVGAAVFVAPSPANAGSPHPYFRDQGTLSWSTCLEGAQREARATGKLILVEYGRLACRNCRVLVETILPAPGVRERAAATCVGLAADCDEPDPRIDALLRKNLADATVLPWVGIVTADLRWVCGWAGGIDAIEIGPHLSAAESTCRAQRAKAAAACAPAPAKPAAATSKPAAAPSKPAVAASKPAVVASKPAAAPAKPLAAKPATTKPESRKAEDARPAAAPRTVALHAPSGLDPANRIPVAPSAPAAPVKPAAAPAASAKGPAPRAIELLVEARAAAARGAYGDVVRCDAEASELASRVEPAEWATLVADANAWSERCLCEALTAGRSRRCAEAARLLASVREAMAGRPAAADAERGERALDLSQRLASTEVAQRGHIRGLARAAFRGSRWSALFEG